MIVRLGADWEAERGNDGIWSYAGTGVPVPGARDVTLAEVMRPLTLGRPDEEPAGVYISAQELQRHPMVRWALDEGEWVDLHGKEHLWVSWATWEEHANAPVDVAAPEQGDVRMERRLARVERDVRLTRHDLDVVTRRRLETILAFSNLGWSRRRIGEFIGVSATRVQQFVEEAPDDLHDEVEQILRDATRLIPHLPVEPIDRDDVPAPRGWDRLKISRLLDCLVELELVIEEGRKVTLTQEARDALERLERRRKRPAQSVGAPE
jgi:hypothetical protein